MGRRELSDRPPAGRALLLPPWQLIWYDEDRETSNGSRRIGISATYLSEHAQDVKDRLLMGGVRLAHVLNSALDPAYRI